MALLDDIATIKLLPDPAPAITPRMIIFHTMGGTLRGTDSWFRNSVGDEAHFGIGGTSDGDLDGVIWQWVDTGRQADANRGANPFAISIETSDGNIDDQPWSPRQLDSLVTLTKRLCAIHDIPMRVVTSAEDPEGGLGWHVMFGAPGPWTKASGKTCPGPVRIAQLKNVVFPALRIGVSGAGQEDQGKHRTTMGGDMLIYAFGGSIFLLHAGKTYKFALPADVQRLKDQGVPDAGEMSSAFHSLFDRVG